MKRTTKFKLQMKSYKSACRKTKSKPLSEMGFEDKVSELEKYIKNCEYDLSYNFKNNVAIKNKLNNAKEELNKLQYTRIREVLE
jgi:hypothetical protein